MSESVSRRKALKKFMLLFGAVGVLGETQRAHAADLPHLSPDDPTAKALGYTDDATKVDKKANATYQAGQACHTCQQLQGTDGQPWRPCTIFAGKLVNADGWCKVWVKKA